MHAHENPLWVWLKAHFKLDIGQLTQFKRYCSLLQDWNERMNLTAILEEDAIIQDHFADSLALTYFIDLTRVNRILDVGAGAGFPSIPLKIAHPHLSLVLLEVIAKKRLFLEHVIAELDLANVAISDLDFRTYIRLAQIPTDVVVARASLDPLELVRIFSPSNPHHGSLLVYWASAGWEAPKELRRFIISEKPYIIGKKGRRLVFMSATGTHKLIA